MKTITSVILAVTLACASGCTHPDWIERTLVTVDVTGAWHGRPTMVVGSGTAIEVLLDLQQSGPKVNGSIRVRGVMSPTVFSGPIEGTIAGDTFSFRRTNGSTPNGELTVNGDEMNGIVRMAGFGALPVLLQRVGSSPDPSSPKP